MKEQEQEHLLVEVYERLKHLKEQEGVKMKDIAAATGWAPSVLSALYATVLPTFCMQVKKGVGMEEALAEALASVNNLSRKKLLSELESLHRDVSAFRSPHAAPTFVVHPFLQTMKTVTEASSATENNLTGMYMSYSCSSSMKALKAEPFYFTDSEAYGCFAVGRKSVHNSIREGIGVVRKQQMLYLQFNAFQEPNFSLVTVYLQLPFLENIRFLKGLYLVPDYNMNPIARRIVLVKRNDVYDPETFAQMDARLIMPDEFTEEEALIYNYTCGQTDYIKMCTLPSPKLDLRDLQAEKRLLEKEEEFEEE